MFPTNMASLLPVGPVMPADVIGPPCFINTRTHIHTQHQIDLGYAYIVLWVTINSH